MDFYYTKSSPYANCVRMVISEIGIQEQINFIESHPFKNDSAFLQASPLGKVPCLDADGEIILDSEVICDFLDASFTGGELFNPVYADWRLKSLYSMVSGLIDTCVARQVENLRRDDNCFSEFWWNRHNSAISRALKAIEERQPLMPEEFTILHINLLSALTYLDFRHKDIEWRKDYSGLSDFFNTWKSRESYTANPLQG
ncbi:MAG: glutathione S-transferase N-terminal domain-containing protein [Kangiellaceae bacterium]|nr:glutathione S-transferase N-terminal domain-containing protein [Kangiellaceae bacterium]MCW9017699.1 glutathione S-transferase N-terminal domain-containing protein [Kangiellaceae bacterium]